MRDLGELFMILDSHRKLSLPETLGLFNTLEDIRVEEVKADMDAERSFDGEPWDLLSDNPPRHGYASWKGKHYPDNPIGELTGKMKAEEQIRGEHKIVFDRAYVLYGTDDEVRAYARTFNDGRPNHNQPARPFLGFSARCQERMSDAMNEFMEEFLKGPTS